MENLPFRCCLGRYHRSLFWIYLGLTFLSALKADIIYSTSFESPVVGGSKVKTIPDGWLKDTAGFGADRCGLSNTSAATFTTTFGSQAAVVWYSQSSLTTADSTFREVSAEGVTYTVTFNVAKASDLSGVYKIDLIVLDPGETRTDNGSGTVLASSSGTASASDMSETYRIEHTVTAGEALKLLAIQIEGAGAMADNIIFSHNGVGDVSPPIVMSYFPNSSERGTVGCNFLLTFSENITKGTGNIVVKKKSDDSIQETIDVTSLDVSITDDILEITRSVTLDYDTAYYVEIDGTALQDENLNNYSGISNKTTWSFYSEVADGKREIFSDSFESPVVTGTNKWTAPDNWNLESSGSLSYWKQSGLSNVDGGTFTTPFGNQVATIWGPGHTIQSSLTVKESAFSQVVTAGITYMLKFNLAKGTNLDGDYIVQLVAFDAGATRDDWAQGTVLAQISGTASQTDLYQSSANISFTASDGDPSLGKLLGIQMEGMAGILIDNLKLFDNQIAQGTIIKIE